MERGTNLCISLNVATTMVTHMHRQLLPKAHGMSKQAVTSRKTTLALPKTCPTDTYEITVQSHSDQSKENAGAIVDTVGIWGCYIRPCVPSNLNAVPNINQYWIKALYVEGAGHCLSWVSFVVTS